jgi:hypothetical protein
MKLTSTSIYYRGQKWWSYTSTPPYVFMARYLSKYRQSYLTGLYCVKSLANMVHPACKTSLFLAISQRLGYKLHWVYAEFSAHHNSDTNSCAMGVGPTWREERSTLSPESTLRKKHIVSNPRSNFQCEHLLKEQVKQAEKRKGIKDTRRDEMK